MDVKVIGTGSTGNCYLLSAGEATDQSLLLDAGLPAMQIITNVKNWNSIAACLITHEHGDHSKSAYQLARYGVPVYATQGTIDAISTRARLTPLNAVKQLQTYTVGQFTIMAFPTEHDAAEPCGWLIRYEPTGETVLYATDTYYLRHTFPGINYWIIECNYIESLLIQQLENDELADELKTRLVKSHMSLRHLCDVFKANDMTQTTAILLVHLSDARSDEKAMVSTIKAVTHIDDVWAAKAGNTYQMHLTPF